MSTRRPRKAKPKKAPARKKSKSRPKKGRAFLPFLKKAVLWGTAGFIFLSVSMVLLYKYVDPPTTPLLWIRWAESGFDVNRPKLLGEWVPLDKISRNLVRAVLTSEDQKFERHSGFDWSAVKNAIEVNLNSNRMIGASTISMQTARNVFLWQNRDWIRKGLEAYFTVLIEMIWGKRRILEVYLNIIEWGDGVFGCEQAARVHFHRPVERVSQLESAWLAAILPNPRKWPGADYEKRVRRRQETILRRMRTTSLQFLKQENN